MHDLENELSKIKDYIPQYPNDLDNKIFKSISIYKKNKYKNHNYNLITRLAAFLILLAAIVIPIYGKSISFSIIKDDRFEKIFPYKEKPRINGSNESTKELKSLKQISFHPFKSIAINNNEIDSNKSIEIEINLDEGAIKFNKGFKNLYVNIVADGFDVNQKGYLINEIDYTTESLLNYEPLNFKLTPTNYEELSTITIYYTFDSNEFKTQFENNELSKEDLESKSNGTFKLNVKVIEDEILITR